MNRKFSLKAPNLFFEEMNKTDKSQEERELTNRAEETAPQSPQPLTAQTSIA